MTTIDEDGDIPDYGTGSVIRGIPPSFHEAPLDRPTRDGYCSVSISFVSDCGAGNFVGEAHFEYMQEFVRRIMPRKDPDPDVYEMAKAVGVK